MPEIDHPSVANARTNARHEPRVAAGPVAERLRVLSFLDRAIARLDADEARAAASRARHPTPPEDG